MKTDENFDTMWIEIGNISVDANTREHSYSKNSDSVKTDIIGNFKQVKKS